MAERRQLTLPGIRLEPSSSEIRELVRFRLAGFAVRHAARLAKRKKAAWMRGYGSDDGPTSQSVAGPSER